MSRPRVSVDDLKLSPRAKGALEGGCIHLAIPCSIESMQALGKAGLANVRTLGAKSLAEICSELERLGVPLPAEQSDAKIKELQERKFVFRKPDR